MEELYYTPPSNESFEELKTKSIDLWKTYNNDYGYVDVKVGRIKDLENVGDNFMYMVAMFDMGNQLILSRSLSESVRKDVRDRLIAGGAELQYIVF